MKNIITLIFTIFALSAFAQDKIKLKSGKSIKITEIHKFDDKKVYYVVNGSLHDVFIQEVDYIVFNKETIAFSPTNKPIFSSYEAAKIMKEPVVENKPIEQAPENNKEESIEKEEPTVIAPINRSINQKVAVFTRPLGIVEEWGKFLIGINAPVSNEAQIKISAAVITQNTYDSGIDVKSGFEIGGEAKKILSTKVKKENRIFDTYISGEVKYKRAFYTENWSDVDYKLDNNGNKIMNANGYYEQEWYYYSQNFSPYATILNLKFGVQKSTKNLFLDAYGGFGNRNSNGARKDKYGGYSTNFVFNSRPNFCLGLDLGFFL